jgi:hypothetical protein
VPWYLPVPPMPPSGIEALHQEQRYEHECDWEIPSQACMQRCMIRNAHGGRILLFAHHQLAPAETVGSSSGALLPGTAGSALSQYHHHAGPHHIKTNTTRAGTQSLLCTLGHGWQYGPLN